MGDDGSMPTLDAGRTVLDREWGPDDALGANMLDAAVAVDIHEGQEGKRKGESVGPPPSLPRTRQYVM